MASDGIGKNCGGEGPRGDVASPFGLDFVASLDPAVDHADGGEFGEPGGAWVGALRAVPIDNLGNAMGSKFEPTVTLVHGLEPLDLFGRCGFEIAFAACSVGWLSFTAR